MIRRIALSVLVVTALGALPVAAIAPETSPRPLVRHAGADTAPPVRPRTRPEAAPAAEPMALVALPPLRPRQRPVSEQDQSFAARPATAALLGPDISARPLARPDSVVQQALFAKRKQRRGAVCGDLDIQGEEIGAVPGRMKGCGVRDAVRVRSVSGVMLSQPAVMDCPTAQALNRWVEKGVKPAFRRRGPVVELRVAAHYVCRTRNNKPGARISEHGRGKAIDISAFTMNSGEVITVSGDWGRGAAGRALREVWKSACGPFGTVLGPNADRYHRNHFHVDTARHRGGPYCR